MQGPDSGEAAQTTVSRQAAEGGYITLSLALFHPSIRQANFLSSNCTSNPQKMFYFTKKRLSSMVK